MAATNGAVKAESAKQMATTTAVSPVRPPASIPVADSTKAPEVVVPNSGASTVASASAIMGRSICGRLPCSSRKPARAESPMSVPMVSTKAMMKMVRATGRALGESAPRRSICAKMGAMLMRELQTSAVGHGATRVANATSAVVTIPMRIAPGTLRIDQRADQQESEDGHQHRSAR